MRGREHAWVCCANVYGPFSMKTCEGGIVHVRVCVSGRACPPGTEQPRVCGRNGSAGAGVLNEAAEQACNTARTQLDSLGKLLDVSIASAHCPNAPYSTANSEEQPGPPAHVDGSDRCMVE